MQARFPPRADLKALYHEATRLPPVEHRGYQARVSKAVSQPASAAITAASSVERRHGRRDGRVFLGPVEPGAGQEAYHAAIKARMHPVAVEFDFVQPLRPFGRLVDQSGELRFDPGGERSRFGAPPSGGRSCHASTASSWPGFATKPAGPILSSALGRVSINRQTSGDESPDQSRRGRE
jgi:hypothetical protein